MDELLSPLQCRQLLNEQKGGEWIASAVALGNGSTVTGGGRKSDSLVLPGEARIAHALMRDIECRLQAMFGIRPADLEPWQMTRYRRGDAYDYHLDCGVPHPSGERKRTLLIVLEQPARGGATHFRALNRSIQPRVGRFVLWRNLLPNGLCNHAMIHAGRPVRQGCKTILTTWEHLRPYHASYREIAMATSKDDKIVKDIIKRYGGTLDLKSSPYLIVEIIRQFGPQLGGGVAASCQPPGGTKPGDPSDLIKELKGKMQEVARLSVALEKSIKLMAAVKPKANKK
ncbi:2OG-Fe(II) oxygenase [Xanthomonas populi]|uniref:2OG-Fe(II) oxygenase n=1 Tax=Xanthomonas populi TaxID=53414 RepID=UPI0013049D1B|nr:2OG-Fe(II) oxygenase [Xanthomonas populi]